MEPLRHPLFASLRAFRVRMGPPIRTPSGEDDSGSRNQHPIPSVGLDLDLEHHRRCRCQSP
jgi:hypothetical protein